MNNDITNDIKKEYPETIKTAINRKKEKNPERIKK